MIPSIDGLRDETCLDDLSNKFMSEDKCLINHYGRMSNINFHYDVVNVLKNIFDPELGVNIYDLGLIYSVATTEDFDVFILMTLTSAGCPVGDELLNNVKSTLIDFGDTRNVDVLLTFSPPWSINRCAEDIRLVLGIY